MLGDTLPWFLPLFVFSLLAWIFYEAIEGFLQRKNSDFTPKGLAALRWLPAIQLMVMLLNRSIAVVQRDLSHIEVAQYLGPGEFRTHDLKLILVGDGGVEIICLGIVLFVLFSDRLPSLSKSQLEIRYKFRNRLMLFSGIMLLSASTLLFPEEVYYNPSSYPLEPFGSLPPLSAKIPLALLGFLVMFGGELFAVSTLFLAGDNFQKIAQRARLKVALFALITIFWLSRHLEHENNWVQQIPDSGLLLPLVLFLHIAVSLAVSIQPAVRIESELNHGEGRSLGMLVLTGGMAVLILVLTPIHLAEIGIFGPELGPYVYGVWMAAVTVSAMMLVQFLPTLGFDAAPRPEIWWMKMTLVFSPIIISFFTPFAIFLIPAIWLVLPWSTLTPWFVEKDVLSPSFSFVFSPVVIMTIMCATVPFASNEPFLAALWFGWVPGAMTSIGLMLHIKQTGKISSSKLAEE
tara:strand:+ start:18197 stop:19576 length:1380 start_codon:yes stop_codon:yes gene_type:complete